MRDAISFDAAGTTLRGWLFTPDHGRGSCPVVVMAHGWGAVKEIFLDLYAETFAGAGMAVVVFDHRNFGASDGTPRQEIDPWAQVNDYRHAITFASTLPGVDRRRIGVWGTSYSGGHVLVVGAIDRRVKCVVAQCPTISGWRNTLRRFPGDTLGALREHWNGDRLERFRGGAPKMSPLLPHLELPDDALSSLDPDAVGPSGNDGETWFRTMAPERRASWRNEITLRSLEMYAEYEPGFYISRIAPTPLLIITADGDTLTPTDEILAAYEGAREKKKLCILPGGHYDLYGTQRAASAAAARDWLSEHV